MSELTTQAEQYERLSRKFTSLYYRAVDNHFLVVTDLETKSNGNADTVASEVFLTQVYNIFEKSPTFLLELVISTLSQDRTLVVRRINFFGSEGGLFFLKSLPTEKDIKNPKESLQDFRDNYAKRFEAIKNQIISHFSSQPDKAIEKLQNEFGFQLTEEILSGGEGLSRHAAKLPEEFIKQEEVLYRPLMLVHIPADLRKDEIPIIPRVYGETEEIPLLQPGRELLDFNFGSLLKAIFEFCSSFLTNVQFRYSLYEEKEVVAIYKSFTNGIRDIVETESLGWSVLLQKMQQLVEKPSLSVQDDATREKEIHQTLKFARRRTTSFLISKWYPEFLESSIGIIRKANRRSLLEFIMQSNDLGILGGDQGFSPEKVLDELISDSQSLLNLVEQEEKRTAIRSVRSSIQSRIIIPDLLNDFTSYCNGKMRIACNTGPTAFDPSRNVSNLLADLEAYRRIGKWETREIEKVRQSVNMAVDELNQLKPRQISKEDLAGLFDYLKYWGVDPPGGSIIRSGTLVVSSNPSWVMSFQLDQKVGVAALVCLESSGTTDEDTSAGLHDLKSLQAVLSRLKQRIKDRKGENQDSFEEKANT